MIKLYIVVPCFNEQDILEDTNTKLLKKLSDLCSIKIADPTSKIVFVDDGSTDKTWNIICNIHNNDTRISGLALSKNQGHQNALMAGLMAIKDYADVVVSLDADLQDDLLAVDEMIKKYQQGCDIVYGVRSTRKKDTLFKRYTAEGFYKLLIWLGVNVIYNHADFRLMSKRALDALAQYQEVNLFLRGIIPMIGFKSDIVYYERKERLAGKSKYNLQKMVFLALEGITSFSIKPIRMITCLGILLFLVSIGVFIWAIVGHMMGSTVWGWTSLMSSLWAIGGLILLSLGIIGEYIGKMYLETKHRPRYIVSQFLDDEHGYGKV